MNRSTLGCTIILFIVSGTANAFPAAASSNYMTDTSSTAYTHGRTATRTRSTGPIRNTRNRRSNAMGGLRQATSGGKTQTSNSYSNGSGLTDRTGMSATTSGQSYTGSAYNYY